MVANMQTTILNHTESSYNYEKAYNITLSNSTDAVCLCGTSVAAAENMISPMYLYNDYFTGGTGTMNSMAGSHSKIFNASSGSISTNARVTNVELNVTVSRGSIPFYIVVESPNGYQAERYISTSGKVEFDEFNDFYPKGTWKIYIYNRGSAFTDVSTATARITVNYGYDSYS